MDAESYADAFDSRMRDLDVCEGLRVALARKYSKLAPDPSTHMQPRDPRTLTPSRLQDEVDRAFPGRGATSSIDFAAGNVFVTVPPRADWVSAGGDGIVIDEVGPAK